MLPRPVHRRSVAFLELEEATWACFLVTFETEDGAWRGYFSFRPDHGDVDEDQIRTADIFLESSEDEIRRKARGLGRPLLSNLLASALHTHEQESGGSPRLRRWFRTFLSESSRSLTARTGSAGASELVHTKLGHTESARASGAGPAGSSPTTQPGPDDVDLAELKSLYASYRLDQVAHFIALVPPSDLPPAVERILEGRSIDFRTRDRLQFAMIVVEYIEQRLPLPPFDVWAEDYLANRQAYLLYAHTLHREGRLP